MDNDAINPLIVDIPDQNETIRSPDIWDNTPEQERLEIEALMEMANADMDASMSPYDWGDEGPP